MDEDTEDEDEEEDTEDEDATEDEAGDDATGGVTEDAEDDPSRSSRGASTPSMIIATGRRREAAEANGTMDLRPERAASGGGTT
jgi:hypothetical protein